MQPCPVHQPLSLSSVTAAISELEIEPIYADVSGRRNSQPRRQQDEQDELDFGGTYRQNGGRPNGRYIECTVLLLSLRKRHASLHRAKRTIVGNIISNDWGALYFLRSPRIFLKHVISLIDAIDFIFIPFSINFLVVKRWIFLVIDPYTCSVGLRTRSTENSNQQPNN